jgi:excisionase family DNA binding protein
MVTVTEAAAQLGLSARAVAYRLERGMMQGVKVNPRLWLVPSDEVERWRGRGRLPPGRKPKTAEG